MIMTLELRVSCLRYLIDLTLPHFTPRSPKTHFLPLVHQSLCDHVMYVFKDGFVLLNFLCSRVKSIRNKSGTGDSMIMQRLLPTNKKEWFHL